MTKLKDFEIASLNISSLLKYIDELYVLLKNSSLDILAINEIPNDEINLAGCNMIRNDRSRSGGGVVLFLESRYPFLKGKISFQKCLK